MRLRVAIGPSSFAEADPEPLRMLESADVEVVPNPFGRRLTEDEIRQHLQGVHGLIAGLEPLHAGVLSSASDLRALARVGIGMENVDIAAAKQIGIAVSNTPEAPTEAVAELTITALLSLVREILPMNVALHDGQWTKRISGSLAGATLLIVGFGRIGRRVADLAQCFGARILVVDPALDGTRLSDRMTAVSLESGLAEADIISLHASGKQCILDSSAFARMKPGVVLLNAARGALVDEEMLIQALRGGVVQSAWFDTFSEEPYHGPLCAFPQVLLTPHVGTYTVRCRREMEIQAVQNILRDLK